MRTTGYVRLRRSSLNEAWSKVVEPGMPDDDHKPHDELDHSDATDRYNYQRSQPSAFHKGASLLNLESQDNAEDLKMW
ncbi:MAG TPA: hypothetical protein VKB81_13095 [Nitrospira sp.]|nr:hypothetical protein [Nitrospira sp.]